MTIFNITDTTSVLVTAANTNAFDGDSAGADTLIVGAAAYLIAIGSGNGGGAYLAPTGAWKVTVNGTILSRNAIGLFLDAGIAGVSTITVGADGEISGSSSGFNSAVVLRSDVTLKNAGTIGGTGNVGLLIDAGVTTTITNTGFIGAATSAGVSITSGDSIVKVTNSGVLQGAVTLGNGDDTVTNSGSILGIVNMGGGNDVVTNTGTIAGTINLGDGNDSFKGGKAAETVDGGLGSDNINLGAGDDTFLAAINGADGTDTIDGGAGIDTYDYSIGFGLRINLDKVAHDSPFNPGADLVAANTAIGTLSNTSTDIVKNFENVIGSVLDDVIYGNAAANRLDGAFGPDILVGYGGKDTLIGDYGLDRLYGGAGSDTLWGGLVDRSVVDGATDYFVYTALSDSGTTKATRDVIMDFEDQFDQIDLSRLDANTTLAGDQAFNYININSSVTPAAMFTKVAGELRSYLSAEGVIVEGDVNGDGKADFSLELHDPTHAIVLTAADFVL